MRAFVLFLLPRPFGRSRRTALIKHTPRHLSVNRADLFLGRLCVFRHPRDIDYHNRFVAHDPCVMSRRHQRHFAWTELVLTPVIHADLEASGDMVCQMSSLTAFGIYDWFYAGRPFPSGLQGGATKRNSAQRYEFQLAFVERTLLFWGWQSLLFHLCHDPEPIEISRLGQAGSPNRGGCAEALNRLLEWNPATIGISGLLA